jgi:hypothetical protein
MPMLFGGHALQPDVIFVETSPCVADAPDRSSDCLIGVADPIGAGLIKDFARPGGNATGVHFSQLEMGAKRLNCRGFCRCPTRDGGSLSRSRNSMRCLSRALRHRTGARDCRGNGDATSGFPPGLCSRKPDAIYSGDLMTYGMSTS